ncbi:pectin methylesterase, family CE8 [Zostera marina]|uniref:Pectinesterase n=1 Tax=Zostera marina TaxID=29655 RepID=A0A0K9NY40_ZOSMR|nr:pectin methylesterase, family CE8 [Zostera marina]
MDFKTVFFFLSSITIFSVISVTGGNSTFQVAQIHCNGTLYPSLCMSMVSSIPEVKSKSLPHVISHIIAHTTIAVRRSSRKCSKLLHKRHRHLQLRQRLALTDCLELFDSTIEDLESARFDMLSTTDVSSYYHDLQTILSAGITNQGTCLDGFSDDSLRYSISKGVRHISQLVSNSLAMSKKLDNGAGSEMFYRGGFPEWMTRKDRRLLQSPLESMKIDLVVAKDGTGDYKTISEAVAAAPNKSKTRFVIYIKKGGYFENVDVPSYKPNLMFIGDGMWKTVVKSYRNVVDGWTTFRSATVSVVGNGFLARDMTFQNSAGPSKHQAVAFRSDSDLSAFYRCSFAAFQDTLYVHSFRQFYRDCTVYGTVDFIFGDGAVILQNCQLYARKPNPGQMNIFTAQGRQDPNQNTGISIQNCKMAAASDLIPVQHSFKTYLGRPWKKYSRTVVMGSYLDDLIDPSGWKKWSGNFALSTLYYGEYNNRGPGSNTKRRVTWPGYKVIVNTTEASQFASGTFIQGEDWLPLTTFPYASDV